MAFDSLSRVVGCGTVVVSMPQFFVFHFLFFIFFFNAKYASTLYKTKRKKKHTTLSISLFTVEIYWHFSHATHVMLKSGSQSFFKLLSLCARGCLVLKLAHSWSVTAKDASEARNVSLLVLKLADASCEVAACCAIYTQHCAGESW